jgi:hypothetical protein
MAAQEAVLTIIRAAGDGDTEGVARMLDEDPQLLSTVLRGETLLVRAAEGRSVGMVRLLLEKGAEVNAINAYGRTALYAAAINGREEVVSILLRSGADPSRSLNNGMTPLYVASMLGYEAVVQVLLRHIRGRGVDDRTNDGHTALWIACAAGHVEIVRALFLAGADHNIADNQGRTPLQVAEQSNRRECIAIMEVRRITDVLVIQPTVHGFGNPLKKRTILLHGHCTLCAMDTARRLTCHAPYLVLLQEWEGHLQRAYVLHKARALHEGTATRNEVSAAPVPAYLRPRADKNKGMPHVEMMGRDSTGGRVTRGEVKNAHVAGGEEVEKEKDAVLAFVEDLAAELYTELMAGFHF